MSTTYQVNSTYNFKCYAPSILSSDFSNVVVLSVLSFSIASKFREVSAVHAQIYNQLPSGTPNQPEKYTYLQIQFPDKSTDIIGIPWIDDSSVQLVDNVVYDVVINGLTSSDYTKVSQALQANGITNFTITMQ